jgi:type I restriction enzyme, R subunit
MKFTTEDQIETYNLELLDAVGYRYTHGAKTAPDDSAIGANFRAKDTSGGAYGATDLSIEKRQSFGDVLLKDRLTQALARINPHIPPETRHQAQRELQNIASPDLIANNETFHRYLTEGITVEYQRNNETKGEQLWLIDWDNLDNNEFIAVNQFTIIEDGHDRRPDIILFINGLPLVVIELKNASDAKADLQAAFNQLQTYKREIPSLFTYNALLVISDGLSARAGSLSATYSRFSQWKHLLPNGEIDNYPNTNELEILTQGMLNKSTLLDLIRHFTVFEKIKTEDSKTEIISLQTIKKIGAYHQYYAVNKAVDSVISATQGNHRGGVVWHTQGSGKSLSMVLLSGKLVLTLDNPTVLILTDRNDLDDQLFDTFAGCRQLLRQDPQQADNREEVRELLNVNSGGIVFTTVQKFTPVEGETIYPKISDRTNIIVLAHR